MSRGWWRSRTRRGSPPSRRWTPLRDAVTLSGMPIPRSRFFIWCAIPLLLVMILTAQPASAVPAAKPGQQVTVTLTSGERLTGKLVSEDRDGLVIEIAGIKTTIRRDHVERVVVQRSALERYRSMRAIIDDDDVPRLLLLVDWLMEADLLDQARVELDAVLDLESTNPDAQRLSRLLDQRITLRDRSVTNRPDPGAETPPRDRDRVRATPPGRFAPGAFPLLTPEQINLIKVYELDLRRDKDILVDRDTAERFLTLYSGAAGLPRTEVERNEFLRLPAAEIVDRMFKLRARELYGEIRVLELPASLRLFRDHVAGTWLTRNCGSTSCHGGTDAPPPSFYNRRPFSEPTFMTNFLIVDRFRFDDGTPLIDYDRPGDSAILQLALPRPDSARPHPDVPGWKPALRSRDALRYQQAVAWLDAMIRPRPTYPVAYTPPDPGNPTGPGEGDPAGVPNQER